MAKNYFAIERNGECYEPVTIRDKDGNIWFEDLMNLSYTEMKNYDRIEEFVCVVMDVTNKLTNSNDENTAITLIDEDGFFIWGIIIGSSKDSDEIHYVFIDWQKDGQHFKYDE